MSSWNGPGRARFEVLDKEPVSFEEALLASRSSSVRWLRPSGSGIRSKPSAKRPCLGLVGIVPLSSGREERVSFSTPGGPILRARTT